MPFTLSIFEVLSEASVHGLSNQRFASVAGTVRYRQRF